MEKMNKTKWKAASAVAACAAMTAGMAIASFAASGWVADGDDWYYYNSSGDYVTDAWKTSNGYYFYLGDDGVMVRDSLIEDGDDYYYVDANGVRVTNRWVAVEADDDEEEDVDYRWYYFNSTGKACTDVLNKTINGKKYGFDEDGKMLFGYVDEDGEMVNDEDDPILEATYYFGDNDDGARYEGWLLYTDSLEDDDDDYDDYDELWFWFSTSNGKKVTDQTKKINGYNYIFDENGVMLYEFVDTSSSGDYDSLTATSSKYYSGSLDDGSLKKNSWIWAEIPEDWGVEDLYEDDVQWFRTDSSGYLITNQTKKINSKWYAFDENGVMLSGLVELSDSKVSGSTVIADIDQDEVDKDDLIENYSTNIFFFSSNGETDGSMKTGSSVKVELADDTYTFGFNKSSGLAYHGVKSNKVYDHGVLLKADSDEKYEIVDVDECFYVVNTSGTRQKAGKYCKTGDDTYLVVIGGSDDEGYVIAEVDTLDEAKELLDD